MNIVLGKEQEARMCLGERRYCNACGHQVHLSRSQRWEIERMTNHVMPGRSPGASIHPVLWCPKCKKLPHWRQTRPTPERPEGYEAIMDMDK